MEGSVVADDEFVEKEAISYYFTRGYKYSEILNVLDKNNGHKTSYSTLLRRLKSYGLNMIQKAEEDDEGLLRIAYNRIE